LEAFVENVDRAASLSKAFQKRFGSLAPAEAIVTHSAIALGALALSDLDTARYHIAKGRHVVDEHGLDRAGRLPRDLAQLFFALGELRRRLGEAVRLSPPPDEFASEFERRCQLLLDAQTAYSDTMRAYDAHWSAMAGYRVGELYERLHSELMSITPPKSAKTERQRQLFEGAMRLRYAVLLDKGLAMMEHTLAMAERTGQQSAWVKRAELSRERIIKARQTEQEALDKLPFSRADLERALNELESRSAATPAAPAGSSGSPEAEIGP
jgi:hypothetical protein